MVRALLAQGALRPAHTEGALAAASIADDIQLQGGATWSLTALDLTLAALVPARGMLNQQTDRAHAMLVNAMASFAPMASAESSLLLPPVPADAYAVAVAAAMQ